MEKGTIVKDIEELVEWMEDACSGITITKLEDGSYRIVDEWDEE